MLLMTGRMAFFSALFLACASCYDGTALTTDIGDGTGGAVVLDARGDFEGPSVDVGISGGALGPAGKGDGADTFEGRGGGGPGGGTGGIGGTRGATVNASMDFDASADSAGTLPGDNGSGRDAGARDANADLRAELPPLMPLQIRQLLPPEADLLGLHKTACSHGPAGRLRPWCAISLPGTIAGRRELWVVDLNRAVGDPPRCDGSSPACVRISQEIFTGAPDSGPSYPIAHAFSGDTLIFYGKTSAGQTAIFRGTVFAWQYGWDAPKALTSDRGTLCSGAVDGSVGICITDISNDDTIQPEWDLYAGRVKDGLLKRIDHIVPTRSNGASQWRSGFTTDGTWFYYSTGGKLATQVETLYASRVGDLGDSAKRITVATGVSRWTLNAAGTRVLFFRAFTYNPDLPRGVLSAADAPSGANEVVLRSGVGSFQVLADQVGKDRGVAFVEGVKASEGILQILFDDGQFASAGAPVRIGPSVGLPTFSKDLRWMAFAKKENSDTGLTDLWVAPTNSEFAPCALTTNTEATLFGGAFSSAGDQILWADKVRLDTDVAEGWAADPANCGGRRQFAKAVDFWFHIRGGGLVASTGGDGKVANLDIFAGPGAPSSLPVTVAPGIQRIYALTDDFVVFAMGGTSPGSPKGLFVTALPR